MNTTNNSSTYDINAAMERKQQELNAKNKKRKHPLPYIIILFVLIVICSGLFYINTTVKVPNSAKSLTGKNYKDVIKQFKDNGFLNVKFTAKADLKLGVFDKEDTVAAIEISGNNAFDEEDSFKRISEVVIYYHTFPDNGK